ncbi:MAG: glycosyltransferase [Planctomycetota bacterium]|nr:glycosyltransferase [Planctomycetota bacterium]
MKRIAFFTNIISPYRIPFFNCLAKAPGIELKVYYLAEQEKDRQWQTYYGEIRYSYEILRGFSISFRDRSVHLNTGVKHSFSTFQPDLVVVGTDILSSPASWMVLHHARAHRLPIIRYEANHLYNPALSSAKQMLYKRYFSAVTGFFAYSPLTEEYLKALGVSNKPIMVGYNVGDTEYFRRTTQAYMLSTEYAHERAQLPEVLFLFSGQLDTRKNILGLLHVLNRLDLPGTGLFILGDGSLRNEVTHLAASLRNMKVWYAGFKDRNECIKYYCLADIFVLPTLYDPASIVLSEALVSGLFVIGSLFDGSAHSFLQPMTNGIVIDPRDENRLAEAILEADHMKRNGVLSKPAISKSMINYTTSAYAGRLRHLVEKILNGVTVSE